MVIALRSVHVGVYCDAKIDSLLAVQKLTKEQKYKASIFNGVCTESPCSRLLHSTNSLLRFRLIHLLKLLVSS